MPFVDLKDKQQLWGLLSMTKTISNSSANSEFPTKQSCTSATLIKHFHASLSRLHSKQNISKISYSVHATTSSHSLAFPLYQAHAIYFHLNGLPRCCLIPSPFPSLVDWTSLSYTLWNVFQAIILPRNSHRRITPVKDSSPSFISHISTVNCQIFNRHLVYHHHCFSRVGTHFFFALFQCLVFSYKPIISSFVVEL